MKKLAFVIIGLMIILGGCTTQSAPQQETSTGNDQTSSQGDSGASGGSSAGTQAETGTAMSLDECLSNCLSAGNTGLADMCRMGCYTDAAQNTKNPDTCEPITQIDDTAIYYTTCLGQVAGAQKSTGPCDRLADAGDKDWCLTVASDDWKDPQVCDGITSEVMKGVCMNKVTESD